MILQSSAIMHLSYSLNVYIFNYICTGSWFDSSGILCSVKILLCFSQFFLFLFLNNENKFQFLQRKAANCARAIPTSLCGDLISSKVYFFPFLFFKLCFFLFTSWRIVSQRGLFCLAQLYLWWAAVIQQRLLNRTNSPGWNTLQRPAIYRIGVRAVFQGPAAVAAH